VNKTRLALIALILFWGANFSVVKGDIRVESTMVSLMKDADVIIPLAALVGAPLCSLDPVGATTVNHDAIALMLKLLSKQQIVLMPFGA